MNNQTIKFIGINTLALAFILTGCSAPNALISETNKTSTKVSSIKPFNSPLEGKVDFGEKFKVKAALSDVAKDATVALIYPSDNTTGNANKTIATGLTTNNGVFKINPDSSFVPSTGEIFILNASKRIGGPGNSLISVQTFVKWNGTGWDSITFPQILLNTKTTALTIISSYNSSTTASVDTIRKFEVVSGKTNSVAINSTDATIDNINTVTGLVSSVINDNQDPIANIFVENGTYKIKTFASTTSNRVSFNGKVYDSNDTPITGAIVNARSIDPGVDWVGEEQVTIGGSYNFNNAPIGVRIAITVTKDGSTTRERVEVLKPNLTNDPLYNVFDFKDSNTIQDEPEVISLKVNGMQFVSSTANSSFANGIVSPSRYTNVSQLTTSTYIPSLTGVASNTLEIEMSFSEPVRRDDVENYLRVSSQQFIRNGLTKTFSIDQNLAGVVFSWSSDDKTVVFRSNKAILANKDGDEGRYAIEFTQPFRDKTDKAAKTQRYFRFTPSQLSDFAVFSVKNDDQAPALLSILARDGGSSADTLELRFSEPMEVINQSSVAAGLADPTAASDTTRQLYVYSTTNAGTANNATVLGYKNSSGNFVASYVIGRITSNDINSAPTTKTLKLSAFGSVVNPFPTALTQYGGTDIFGYRLRSARITGNTVLIEFTPQAFDRDDRVIVAAGTNITANYSDRSNNVGPIDLRPALNFPAGADFAQIQDPSARIIDGGNSTTSANIDVNNQQRVSTVN